VIEVKMDNSKPKNQLGMSTLSNRLIKRYPNIVHAIKMAAMMIKRVLKIKLTQGLAFTLSI
jgi:hypothetical protein